MNSLAHSKMCMLSSINSSLRFGRFYRRKELRKRAENATFVSTEASQLPHLTLARRG